MCVMYDMHNKIKKLIVVQIFMLMVYVSFVKFVEATLQSVW